MPTLKEIQLESQDFMRLKQVSWFAEASNHVGISRGGVYLLSGEPGSGKSTLALQIGIDLANMGFKVLYLTLELSPSDIRRWVNDRIFPHRHTTAYAEKSKNLKWENGLKKSLETLNIHNEEERIEGNFFLDSSISNMETLPDFLGRQVLGPKATYKDIDLIVVDSLQGLGTAPTSSKPYQRLYDFNRLVKHQGIATILIGHVTKGGAIAGPRSLEHNVDCVLYIRKAMKFRPFFVPKNRFGPSRHEPLTLVLDDFGCLVKSKHSVAKASRSYGYLPNFTEFVEVQALVRLPKLGEKPRVKAPYFPRDIISQLVTIASQIKDIDISDLTFEIN